MTTFARWAGKSLLLCLVLLLTAESPALSDELQKPQTQEMTQRKRLEAERQAVRDSTRPYKPPLEISRRLTGKNEVVVSLNVDFALNEIDDVYDPVQDKLVKHTVRTRTYNKELVGGIIRIRPGDVLRVAFRNSIRKCELDIPVCPNEPNGFNITNLHTHGLHVSPERNSDNVYLEIGPEQQLDFCFDVPTKQTSGTHWYHAHRHGSTSLQLSSGMAGPLIVDGGLDTIPEIAEAMKDSREKLLVFTQMHYALNVQNIGEVTKETVYNDAQKRIELIEKGENFSATLINGIHHPVIKMKPGEIQRWRCIHGGIFESIPLSIVRDGNESELLWLHEIARDGLPLYQMERVPEIRLYPGYRSDFLVQAPAQPGNYYLKQKSVAAEDALDRLAAPERYLARVEVENVASVTMKLPASDSIRPFALPRIKPNELVNRIPLPLVFKAADPEFSINGEEFDHDRIDLTPRLNTAEEWALSSEQDTHPFHIHINPFEVVQKDAHGNETAYWRDTIVVRPVNNASNPILIRMRFETFPGKTVLHCHNLRHEDRGMMMAVRVVGKAPPSKCDSPPRVLSGVSAPKWRLLDVEGQEHQLENFAGQNILLIFFRGLACNECRRQLEAIANRHGEFAGLKIIAVSPDSPESMAISLQTNPLPTPLPFLLLSDVPMNAFKQYGCYDGWAQHGTFVIDQNGIVRWQNIGDEPFMDLDDLLKNIRELLK